MKLPIALAALFFTLDSILVRLPRIGFFSLLHWNWQGQILRTIFALAWIAIVQRPCAREAGLIAKIAPSAMRDALAACGIVMIVSVIAVLLKNTMPTDAETIAFEMTMPGIAEELAFRGVIQSLLNDSFPKRSTVLGAPIGCGAIATALLFTALHVIKIDRAWHVTLSDSIASWIGVGLTSLTLGWMRERTKSLWPCIAAHNIANTTLIIATKIFAG